MRIAVLNGSPKGKYSITLQTVEYLQKKYPQCEFQHIHVGQRIKAIEKDFSEASRILSEADMLLFSYPVYTFIAPSQLHRFIELLKESGLDISGKFATQITTSKHFYDVTAHRYIEQNCYDLKLKYMPGLSADMDDLLTEKGRREAASFWKQILFCVENDIYQKPPAPVSQRERPVYIPAMPQTPKKDGFDTVIVTNCLKDDIHLKNMIEDFVAIYPYKARVINIGEYNFAGGCLGCFNCATDGICIYKDNFDSFLRNEIQSASATVYAFTIKDHSMGASFKVYDDRQFCNGHRTVTMGKPNGYIISGDYSKESNLQTIIEGRAEVGQNYLAYVATDEGNIPEELRRLSAKLCYALENQFSMPQNFYGVGGMKIFRDLIYLMRGLMKEDHRFYKKHGMYDFPQKKVGTLLKMKLVGTLFTIPSVRKKVGSKMKDGMIAPYKKAIDKA